MKEIKDKEPAKTNSKTKTSSSTDKNVVKNVDKATSPYISIIVVLSLAVAVLGYLYLESRNSTVEEVQETITETPVDSVVARVNGTEIMSSSLTDRMNQIALRGGVPDIGALTPEFVTQIRSQAFGALINSELLLQAAVASGITFDPATIEESYADIVEQAGGEDALNVQLEELGITKARIKSNIGNDLLISEYISQNTDRESITASEEEIQSLYDQVNAAQEGFPSLEETRVQIEGQIINEKHLAQVNDLVEKLRAEAEVEILTN